MPACNNATVVLAASQPWGIQGTTTAPKFKALKPFEVVFKGPEGGGTKTLVSGTNTSKVSWDFKMMLDPTASLTPRPTLQLRNRLQDPRTAPRAPSPAARPMRCASHADLPSRSDCSRAAVPAPLAAPSACIIRLEW
jgi:hypothetical protein